SYQRAGFRKTRGYAVKSCDEVAFIGNIGAGAVDARIEPESKACIERRLKKRKVLFSPLINWREFTTALKRGRRAKEKYWKKVPGEVFQFHTRDRDVGPKLKSAGSRAELKG